jgi:hypothetical protein
MAQHCEVEDCRLKGVGVYRISFQGGQWRGEECGCARKYRIRTALNPFSFVLDHVHDELGHKVRVESLAQLSAAEQRYGFESCVLNRDAQNFNDTPAQVPVTVDRLYQRKFGRH